MSDRRVMHPTNGDVHWADPSCEKSGCRPVVVIDPEDTEQAERLVRAYLTAYEERTGRSDWAAGKKIDKIAADMQAALREFANPTPPKPEEPTGLGAVVVDEAGDAWVLDRPDDPGYLSVRWLNVRTRAHRDFRGIEAVEVLSEGVQP